MNRKSAPRCLFVLLTLAALGRPSMAAAAGQEKPAARPNILLILMDDLGYADLGCQGCKDVPTPNIDTIAKNGVRCTNGYVSCPVCSPTRAGLMTGRYQQRFGHEFNPGPADASDPNFGLPLTETTLANRMKTMGYATGLVGKWHLGYKPEFHPQRRGFDEFFGFLAGAHAYLGDRKADTSNPILRGTKPVEEKNYLTEAFTREAVSFIDRHQKEPFFLYLAYNAVHNPQQAPQKYLDRFPSIMEERRRYFAAMLSAMDDGIGAVLAKLRQAGVEQDTLIFCISDNGGPTQATSSRNDPLSGRKGQVYEGGIRVPFLVQWRNRLPAGKVYDQPVIALDVVPTVVAATGGQLLDQADLDGVNLLPYLTGTKQERPHEALYWRFGPQSAVRQGDWKLVQERQGTSALYNLATDVGEKKDLTKEKPELAKQLQSTLKRWDSQLAKPRWQKGG